MSTWAVYKDIPNEYVSILTGDSVQLNHFTDMLITDWNSSLPHDQRAIPGSRWRIEVSDDYSFASDMMKLRLSRPAEHIA